MRTLAFFIILLGTLAANAQKPPVWKVTLNKKKVLEASTEDTVKNVIQIKRDDLSNNGVFKLDYKEGSDHPSKLGGPAGVDQVRRSGRAGMGLCQRRVGGAFGWTGSDLWNV